MGDLTAGVVGAGSMGSEHARIYDDHEAVELVGVSDADGSRARQMASEYGVRALELEQLLDRVDLLSVTVPTEYHYQVAGDAIEAGVDLLVESPFVARLPHGEELVERARERGVTLQVGHAERFNPAVQAAADVVSDVDVVAVDANRLGIPVDSTAPDSVVLDMMIHDIDVALALVGSDVRDVSATGTESGDYATATVAYDSGVVGQFTASRVTQQPLRELTVTTDECRVAVDYADQSVSVHRNAVPEDVERVSDAPGQERLVERLTVDSGDPLEREIDSFLHSVDTGEQPEVTGEDGLRALRLAHDVAALADGREEETIASLTNQ